MHSNYLIIGSSAASIGAISKLVNLDKNASITCITADKYMPYNRCLLADLISCDNTYEKIYIKKADFFKKHRITLILNTTIEKLNPAQKQAITAMGQIYTYDKLFLGIGKSASLPKIPGITAHNVMPFFTIQNTIAIKKMVIQSKIKNIIIIGAGLTGLECADALTEYNCNIRIIERADQILPSLIDNEGAAIIEKLIIRTGIKLYKRSTIKSITQHNETVTGIKLTNGTHIQADLVILATGGTSNIGIAKQAGLETRSDGLVMNQRMQTSNSDIFAGGDICLIDDLLTGRKVLSCLWPDAMMQGMVAAYNMAGITRKYPGALIVTSSNIFDTTFVTCRPTQTTNHCKTIIKRGDGFYHRLFIGSDGTLQGFIMVGNIGNVGQLRKAILQKQIIVHPTGKS